MVFPAQGSGSSTGTQVRGYAKYQRISTAQTIADTTLTIFNFDTEVVDTLEGCTVTTGAAWKVTANRALKLTIKVDMRPGSAPNLGAGVQHYMQIYKNGSASDHGNLFVWANGVAQSAAIPYLDGTSLQIDLDSGDYVDLRFSQAQGGNVDWKGVVEISEEY